MSNVLPVVPEADFLENPQVVRAVERLNSVGLRAISENVEMYQSPNGMPISIMRPAGERDRLLNDYDALIIHPLSYANGHHHSPTKVQNALYTQLFGEPVIDLPAPSRSWPGMHSLDSVKGWYFKSESEKHAASLALFDTNARVARDAIYGLDDEQELPGTLRFLSGSMGVAAGASLANIMKMGNDVLSFGGVAIPNTSRRSVYGELFFRDFVHCGDMPGGAQGQRAQGKVPFQPYLEAGRVDTERLHTKRERRAHNIDTLRMDILGRRLKTFRRNESFSRALSEPTAIDQVGPLLVSGIPVTLGFFENDPISRPEVAQEHFAPLAESPNLDLVSFADRDHAGCVNAYIAGYMALRSAGMLSQ